MENQQPLFTAFPQGVEKFIKKFDGSILYMTKERHDCEEKVFREKNEQHQLIQTLVAISSLKDALVTTFLFKAAYLSVFAKGDDVMIFDRISNAHEQLKQVLEQQQVCKNYALKPLLFSPQTLFQDISNEIVEHFKKVLEVISECIKGRGSSMTSTLESYSQTWKWSGWKQIGMTALCSLNTIVTLIGDCKVKFAKDESLVENGKYLDEFLKIAECFQKVIYCFMKKTYPTIEIILEKFKDDPVLNEKTLKAMEIPEKNEEGEKGFFSQFFAGIN